MEHEVLSTWAMIPDDCRLFSIHNHASQAFQVMYELRQRQELCDIILCVDGHRFHAHKVVLAGCSPYLRAMFTNGMLETEKNVVEIQGLESLTMELLLEFMYKGTVEITTENVQLLLQGASMLNLISLRNVCCQFLQQHLDASNCLGIHYFADMYSCTELEVAARRYIYQHFLEVIRHDEFLQLADSRLTELFKSDQLQVTNEQEVFEAAMAWLEADSVRRTKSICDVMSQIRLALLDVTYLEDVVLQTEHMRNCPKCQGSVHVALHTKSDKSAMAMISKRALPLGIFVVGGRNGLDSQLKTMERYDFLRDQWVTMGSMTIARTAVSAASQNGVLYAVGGECALAELQDETLYLQCVEAYNPIMMEWTPCSEMQVARSFVATVATRGHLYALGGEDKNTSYNVVEKYDPKTDTWSLAPSMRQKRAGAGVAVCDGKIYIAGGYDKVFHTDRASVERYDPETQEWSFIAEMENPRSGLVLVCVDHFLYAIGGRSRYHQYFDIGERYNTLTHQWSNIAPMNNPRAWPAVAVIDKKIYTIGGFDGSNRLRSVEVYDPESDSWTFISNMNISRAGCGAAVL